MVGRCLSLKMPLRIFDWGNGSGMDYASNGVKQHTFADNGVYSIRVSLIDEDGTHANAGQFDLLVTPAPEQ